MVQDTVADTVVMFETVALSVEKRSNIITLSCGYYAFLRTWNRDFWTFMAKKIDHIAPNCVWAVEASNICRRWIIVGIWVACSTKTNSDSVVPLHEATLVGEDGICVGSIGYQNSLESVFL